MFKIFKNSWALFTGFAILITAHGFQGNLLQVQLNEKYDAVETSFQPKPARKKVQMNLSCKSDTSLKDTFKSINDKFKN